MDICTAILAINPDAQVSVNEEDFEQISWLEGTTPISKSDIQAKIVELKAAYDAKDYQRKRVLEYPEIGEQLDKIYHDGIDAWKADMLEPVKAKYPKP